MQDFFLFKCIISCCTCGSTCCTCLLRHCMYLQGLKKNNPLEYIFYNKKYMLSGGFAFIDNIQPICFIRPKIYHIALALNHKFGANWLISTVINIRLRVQLHVSINITEFVFSLNMEHVKFNTDTFIFQIVSSFNKKWYLLIPNKIFYLNILFYHKVLIPWSN